MPFCLVHKKCKMWIYSNLIASPTIAKPSNERHAAWQCDRYQSTRFETSCELFQQLLMTNLPEDFEKKKNKLELCYFGRWNRVDLVYEIPIDMIHVVWITATNQSLVQLSSTTFGIVDILAARYAKYSMAFVRNEKVPEFTFVNRRHRKN